MSIPKHIVEEVRARTDIVELIGRTVTLRRKGTSWVGLCPFHDEKSPSFNVVPHKGIFHCFGCGEGGDAIAFVRKTRGLAFHEAVKELASAVGVVVEERPLTPQEQAKNRRRADLYELMEAACAWFETTLAVGAPGQPGREYLATRGVTLDTARRYRLGFAPEGWNNLSNQLARDGWPPDLVEKSGLLKRSERGGGSYDAFRNRLIFPILDNQDRPIAFGGRVLPGADKDTPKYVNSPGSEIYEKSKVLYGLSWARSAVQKRDRLLVVEGYFDALSLWQVGVEEAVAPCGTALTAQHLDAIKRLTRRVIASFDTDEAGLNAAVKSMGLFVEAGIEARRLELPGAKDPDEFIQKFGLAAFEDRLAHTEPLIELVLRRTVQREGTSAEGRARAMDALIPLLRGLPDALRGTAVTRMAGELGVHEAALMDRVGTTPALREPSPAPQRWVPSKELAHLLWLLVHFPERAGPKVLAADPDWFDVRRTAVEAMGQLAQGQPVAAVVDALGDPEVARVLVRVAAEPGLYKEEAAIQATEAILARWELRRLESRILDINQRIAACETSGDKSSYPMHVAELPPLYSRQRELKQRIAGRAPVR